MTRPLSTPVLQARDLILETLLHRKNLIFTEAVCRDAANNAATALIGLLEDLQRGTVVQGEIGAMPLPMDEPPPVRVTIVDPWTHAVVDGKPCTRSKWCGDVDGHEGECCPPF